MNPSFNPAWQKTPLNSRAVYCLMRAGYDTPEKALADDPQKVICLLWQGGNFGKKTEKMVVEFLYANNISAYDDAKNFTDEQLISILKNRGYLVSRPL